MNLLWVWLAWLIAFPLIEGYALWHNNDKAEPLTFYVRRFMGYSLFFKIGVLWGLVWLILHFGFHVG